MKPLKQRVKPFAPLYVFVFCIVWLLTKLLFRFRVDKRAIRGVKEPFVIVSGHTCEYDFVFLCVALFPHLLNVVTARFYYENPIIASLLNLVACIPKLQFVPDVGAIKGMLAAKKAGCNIALYPEGHITLDGATGYTDPAVGKLLKKLGMRVLTVEFEGAFFAKPAWRRTTKRCRVNYKIVPLLSAEEIAALSEDDIRDRVAAACSYNEYDKQRARPHRIAGRDMLGRITNLIHQCPRCKAERAVERRGDRIICRHCGNGATVDNFGFIHPAKEGDAVFPDTVQWAAFQQNTLREAFSDPEHAMSDPVRLRRRNARKPENVLGEGVLTLSRDGFCYRGTDGGQQVEYAFPLASLPAILVLLGDCVRIPHRDGFMYFELEDPCQPARYDYAYRALREMLAEGAPAAR